MKDFTAIKIKEITKEVNQSVSFSETRFPYVDAYEHLNKTIMDAARKGENSICFDFVDIELDYTKSLEETQKNANRIYVSTNGGTAIHNVYEYPNYLTARGFNVEIRKSVKHHGYVSKSYYVSW